MKLKKLLLRYYPPGIILQYEDKDGSIKHKPIDLLEITPDVDLEVMQQLSCTTVQAALCTWCLPRTRKDLPGRYMLLV